MTLLFLGYPSSPIAATKTLPNISALVQQYLDAPEREAAGRQSDVIRSGAPLQEIISALRQGQRYPVATPGLHPQIPLTIGEHQFSYALYLPKTYDPNTSLPLVVCLHSGVLTGERALESWISRLEDAYILVCPTLDFGLNRQWWTIAGEVLLLATLQDVTQQYNVDPNRIFLTGLANGAVGTLMTGMHRADRFAGIVPIAGCLPDKLYPLLANLKHTPVYALHGSQDLRVPPSCTRKMVKAMNDRRYSVVHRQHNYVHANSRINGHFVPPQELHALREWLENRTRNAHPAHIVLVRDRVHLDRFSWVKIDRVTDKTVDLWNTKLRNYSKLTFAKLEVAVTSPTLIEVTADHVQRYTLFLPPSLLDLDQPITIRTNGATSFKGHVEKDLSLLLREARRDPGRIVAAMVTISIPPDTP